MFTLPGAPRRRAVPIAAILALSLLAPPSAGAQQLSLFGGKVLGVWKTVFTVGTGTRSGSPQARLIGAGAGQGDNPEFPGANGAVGVNDDGNLNFLRKSQPFSAPMTLTTELTLRHSSGHGVFLRVRGWYDMVLEAKNVPHGSAMNTYTPGTRLVDNGNLGSAQFSGIDIYDAFYFGHYRVGRARFLVRVGRQALDWGEGLFYPGINAFNAYDYAWATTTGATLFNGGKLPVARVYANMVGPAGFNIDGYANLEFRSSVFPGCGTYFSTLDDGFHPGCNAATAAGLPDRPSILLVKTKNYYNGKLYPNGIYPGGAADHPNATGEPSRWSGWGISTRKFVEPLKTELGVYYTDYTNPFPVNSPVVGTDALTFAVNTNFQPVKSFAVSAATGVRNLTLSTQMTRTLDYPAQRNAPAFIEGSLSGIGPYGYMKNDFIGREAPGYYPMDVTQWQYGGIWQFGRHIGLSEATLVAEADMQWNTNQPPLDGPGAERLGRSGNFGLASWSENGYSCNPGPLSNGIVNTCEIDGFATPFSMGYKVRVQNTFPQMGPGLTVTPAFTLGNDIRGYSVDNAIVGGRVMYAAALRIDVRQACWLELGGTWYRRNTAFDAIRDRGAYTFSMGWNIR